MRIISEAILTLGEESSISFPKVLEYISANGTKISIKDHEDGAGKLIASFEVEADSFEVARPFIESELAHTIAVLSWKRNIQILDSRINSYQALRADGGKDIVVMVEMIGMTMKMSALVTLGHDARKALTDSLSTSLSTKALEIITVWRDAISKQTDFEKYLFLYRLLESLPLPTREDAWLKNNDPTAPTVMSRNRGIISIYTDLRDHVHPKPGSFPAQEIKDRLPRFQDLVRTAIAEAYPELSL